MTALSAFARSVLGQVAFLAALCGLAAGCDGDGEAGAADVEISDAGHDVTSRFWREPPTGDDYFRNGGYLLENSVAAVVYRLSIDAEIEPGVALGFDLDGKVSADGDPDGCGHGDMTGPAGETGVDNQFAAVWGLIEPLVGPGVRALLQEAINEGRFLLILELDGVDDLQNDDSVTLRLMRGRLEPTVGASGYLLPDQTYTIDPDFPVSVVENVSIRDGVVEAGPVEVLVPIEIFDANFTLRILAGTVRFTVSEAGGISGLLAGGIHVQEALDELLQTGAASETQLVKPIFESNADLQKVGETCELISCAFGFEATPAWVVRYP